MGICGVCKENQHKYKCPRCLIIYCSLPCFKQHKADCTALPKPISTQRDASAENKTEHNHSPKTGHTIQPQTLSDDRGILHSEDTVPLKRLDLLQENSQLQQLLLNKHLQTILQELDSATDAACKIDIAMQEPLFVQFADECLKSVTPCDQQ